MSVFPIDLHAHTVASTHAFSTVHDYVAYAKKNQIEVFAITDHGPALADAPHEWHFGNMRVIPRQLDGVTILRGIEANILNDQGDIDCSPRMYEYLDIVLAGFHSPAIQPHDQAYHTRALIEVMRAGYVDIISHPGNPRFPIDVDTVAHVAANSHVALEINNASFCGSRSGSEHYCRQIIEAVKSAGGYISLGSDSHIACTLGELDHCLRLIDEVSFPYERIINVSTSSLYHFLQLRQKTELATLFVD